MVFCFLPGPNGTTPLLIIIAQSGRDRQKVFREPQYRPQYRAVGLRNRILLSVRQSGTLPQHLYYATPTLWSQSRYRADNDTILFAAIGKFSVRNKYHPEGRGAHSRRVYLPVELIQVSDSFRNQRIAAEFNFHKSVRTVPEVDNGIALQPASIMIMGNPSVQCLSVTSEIPHGHCLEEVAERPQVIHEILRTGTKRRHRY